MFVGHCYFGLIVLSLTGQLNALIPSTIPLIRIRHYSTTSLPSTNYQLQPIRSKMINQPLRMSSTSTTTSLTTTNPILTFTNKMTRLFPLWVISFSILGFHFPFLFQWFSSFITPALAWTMLCMGMSLTVSDFARVCKTPQFVIIGFLCQYTIMPLAAATISKVLRLGPELSAGLILVGCAPGGTASNLVTMIAGADVALSVLMTAVSTVAAVVMTPLLTAWLAGSYVTVKASDLVLSTLQVVLTPILAGLTINTFAPQLSKTVSRYTPFLSVLLVSTICGTISASNSAVKIGVSAWKLIAGVVALHSVGFGVGYLVANALGAGETRSRTISIETGMQNSALAVVLAQHFPNPILSSLPGALSATAHSVIGSIMAAYWRSIPVVDVEKTS